MAWHGEVPFPNLLDPLTCQTFLEATHKAYKRHLPEDVFRAIPVMFTDEPHLVANQFGKQRVMNECWGAGGHASTPTDWMRIGRFLVVNGVNLLVPPRIQVVGEATGIYHQRRETPSGVLWLVINLSPAAREVRFAEDIPANSIDLLTGEAATFSGSTLSLPAQSAHLLTEWSDAAAIKPKPTIPEPEQSGAELELDRIEASGPNVLVLDRCRNRRARG